MNRTEYFQYLPFVSFLAILDWKSLHSLYFSLACLHECYSKLQICVLGHFLLAFLDIGRSVYDLYDVLLFVII
jgi:hypothetical protein